MFVLAKGVAPMTRVHTQSEFAVKSSLSGRRLSARKLAVHLTLASSFWGAAISSTGCSLTEKTQLAECQDEKRQLLSRVVDEQRRAESLQGELKVSNQRLADAEKQLARSFGTRGSSPLLASGDLGAPAIDGNATASRFRGAAANVGAGTSDAVPGSTSSGDSITRAIQLGAPRTSRAWDGGFGTGVAGSGAAGSGTGSSAGSAGMSVESGQRDTGGLEIVGPQNGGGQSGWLPRTAPRPSGGTP